MVASLGLFFLSVWPPLARIAPVRLVATYWHPCTVCVSDSRACGVCCLCVVPVACVTGAQAHCACGVCVQKCLKTPFPPFPPLPRLWSSLAVMLEFPQTSMSSWLTIVESLKPSPSKSPMMPQAQLAVWWLASRLRFPLAVCRKTHSPRLRKLPVARESL